MWIGRMRQGAALLCGCVLVVAAPASALELGSESNQDLSRFQQLLEVSPSKDAHEVRLKLATAPAFELQVSAGKVSEHDCHYYQVLLKGRDAQSKPVRAWRSANAIPCRRLAQDLGRNLAAYDAGRPTLIRTAARPASTLQVSLTPGSRIRSAPSLEAQILSITQGWRKAEVGVRSGDWHPLLEQGRTVGYVHSSVVEPPKAR